MKQISENCKPECGVQRPCTFSPKTTFQISEFVSKHRSQREYENLAFELGIDRKRFADPHYELYKETLFEFQDGNANEITVKARHFSDEILLSLVRCRNGPTFFSNKMPNLDIWDTIYYLTAAFDHGCFSSKEIALVQWLLKQQSETGGWACSTRYPICDSDTTAAALLLFARLNGNHQYGRIANAALTWLVSLVKDDGTVKTFDYPQGVACNDVTAAVALAFCRWGVKPRDETIEYLCDEHTSFLYTKSDRLVLMKKAISEYYPILKQENCIASIENMSGFSIRYVGNTYVQTEIWNAVVSSNLNNTNSTISHVL